MKKRFVIPAALFFGFCGLAAVGSAIGQDNINKCNAGDVKVCESIAKLHGTDYIYKDEIKHRSYWKAMADQTKLENDTRIAKEKAAGPKYEFLDNSTYLQACRDDIRRAVNNPGTVSYNSFFASIDRIEKFGVTRVFYPFSASNAFGMVSKFEATCTFDSNQKIRTNIVTASY
jgi:hypothetical protein